MIRHSVAATLNLLRLHTAGFEGFVFTAGPLLNGSVLTPGDYAVLWLIGTMINGYIFALNDVIDLPNDRMNPARSGSPLVTGALSERTALLWSVALPLAAAAVVAALGWPAPAQVSFDLLLVMGGTVNLYQKATQHPLLMDVLFAVTMAAPLPVTARAMSDSVGPPVWYATALLFFMALQLNSIAGNLKDLESDRRTGFRTVALAFGAALSEGRLVSGRAYRQYCWTLFAAIVITGSVGLSAALPATPPALGLLGAVTVVAATICGMWSMHRLLSGARPPSRRGRESYFAAAFLIFLTIIVMNARWSVLPALVLLASWELAFGVFWSWHRRWESSAVPASRAG